MVLWRTSDGSTINMKHKFIAETKNKAKPLKNQPQKKWKWLFKKRKRNKETAMNFILLHCRITLTPVFLRLWWRTPRHRGHPPRPNVDVWEVRGAILEVLKKASKINQRTSHKEVFKLKLEASSKTRKQFWREWWRHGQASWTVEV